MSKDHSQEMKELYNTGQMLNSDYMYCINENQNCIHRRGCKRWLGNYQEASIKELHEGNMFIVEVEESHCIPDYKDKDCKNNFQFLDRFRLSNGEPFKKDEQ